MLGGALCVMQLQHTTTCAEIAMEHSVEIAGVLIDHVCEGEGNKITTLRHHDQTARRFIFAPEKDMLQSAIEGTRCIQAHKKDHG